MPPADCDLRRNAAVRGVSSNGQTLRYRHRRHADTPTAEYGQIQELVWLSMRMTISTGRPSKGDRDQFLPEFPVAVADVLRRNADALQMPHGEYIAAVLAEQFGMPWLSPVETRAPFAGRIQEMLDEAGVGHWETAPESGWAENVKFTTRPARPIGDLVRSRSRAQGMTYKEYIVAAVMAWHGITRDADTVLAPRTRYAAEAMRLPA